MKTIALTGGGSGGHITPLLAVAAELKKQAPDVKLVYIGQKGDSFADIPASDPNIDAVYAVRAGKFRRFHGEGIKQIFDLPNLAKNTRDFFYVLIGVFQSYRVMKKIKPDILFSRGGFVCVPVAIGAKLNKVPYITHDSDPIPSLANRVIAPWAAWHAVAMPEDLYPYPIDRTVTTGIPLNDNFVPVNLALKNEYRDEIDVPKNCKMLFVIGGGLGSRNVNLAVADAVPHLLSEHQDLYVVNIVGRANEQVMKDIYDSTLSDNQKQRLKVLGFIDNVYMYSGAADIIITRAGATNLAEFAIQAKPCIVVPSPFLTAGHQLKSAEYLEQQGAAIVISETELSEDSNRLASQVSDLLTDKKAQLSLAKAFHKFANPDATKKITKLILEQL